MSKIKYFRPMFERLTPRTPWAGGRMTDTDVLTLADAASMATKHAGEPVTIGDFLRAAARGEITLRAIVHTAAKVQKHDGGIYCNGGQENENRVPAGAIATLPHTACQHLAAAGRASWRTFDCFEIVDGVLQRYTKGHVVAGEPDFETVPDDCRVLGYDVHALADEYTAPAQSPATPATVVAESASGGVESESNFPWWRVAYDIHEMAQNIGEKLHSEQKRTSNAAIAKEIEKRINDIERSKGRNRTAPNHDTIRGLLTGWVWRPE